MAYHSAVLVLAALLAVPSTISAFSFGPPLGVCGTMNPEGHIRAGVVPANQGFAILTHQVKVAPGESIGIVVIGSKNISGIFIQVRQQGGDEAVGRFMEPDPSLGFKLLDCFGKDGSAFSHANPNNKGRMARALWTAPANCQGEHVIRVSVVVNFATIQTGLTKTITCAKPTTTTMPPTTKTMPPTTTTMPQVVKNMTTTTTMQPSTTTMPPTTTTMPPTTKTMPPTTTTMSQVVKTMTTTTTMQPTTTTMPPTTTTMPPTTTIMPSTSTTMPPTTTTMPPTTTTMPPTTTTMPPTTTTMPPTTTTMPPTTTTMPPIDPRFTGCMHGESYTVVPSKYATSFESVSEQSGWTNRGWTRNMKSTTSILTGPSGAAHGKYYMYLEASSPAQLGKQAILETKTDLSGCFCLHFALHRNVRYVESLPYNHRFAVTVGGVEEFVREIKDNSWRNYFLQVDSAETVQIKIIGTRGNDWMGDQAIDNIYLIPGMCRQTNN